MNQQQQLNELIKDAYDIAQKENNCYTYEEAKQYDPLISTLFKALMKSNEQKSVDQKLQGMQDENLELENWDGEPIIVDFKKCSVSYVIGMLELTIDNINFRNWSVNDHQIKSLKILKEIEKIGLNYSCCSHQNMYEVVDYE